MHRRILTTCALCAATILASGCFRISGRSLHNELPDRPEAMRRYYAPQESYGSYREQIRERTDAYTLRHITIDSYAGPIIIDYYQGKKPSNSLVLVFPVLGGKNFIESHFARYFVESGLDAAIVNRNNEFKDPGRFNELEQLLRENVIRDRLALDFFEVEYGKTQFGSFGISRGAINVALTAGVDSRLQHNVMAMGGTDLVNLFRDSKQARIEKYIKKVSSNRGYSRDEFFGHLREQIRTDPKYTAHYLDPSKTLLILGLFDRTVPFTYGLKLREQIGRPDTIFLFSDHYVSLAYTQTVSLLPPSKTKSGLFPFPYIEQEAISFYRRSFGEGINWKALPFKALMLPVNVVAEIFAGVGSLVEWMGGKHVGTSQISDDELQNWKEADQRAPQSK